MELIPKEKNQLCNKFENNDNQRIDYMFKIKGSPVSLFNETNRIIFVIKGFISVSFGTHVKEHIRTGQFYFVPAKCQYYSIAHENTEIIGFPIKMDLNFCNYFSFEMLLNKDVVQKKSSKLKVLKINPILQEYIKILSLYLNDGLKCPHMFEIKRKELLLLLKTYYSKKDLSDFFNPILNADTQFAIKVYNNYENVKTSEELAGIMNYSLSGFKKRFKRVFGIPIYEWLKMRKIRSIYHEICCTQKTFSEIAFEYGFSSASHFNDFCKVNLENTPGKIRNKALSFGIL